MGTIWELCGLEVFSQSALRYFFGMVFPGQLAERWISQFSPVPPNNPKPALMTSPAIHRYSRRIQFSETDAAGVVHFSRLATLVEEAEHDWFIACGVAPFSRDFGWPRVEFHIRYHAPCSFGDEVEVMLSEFLWQNATLSYQFHASLGLASPDDDPANGGGDLFSGTMTVCHVRRMEGGGFQAEPIPEEIMQTWTHWVQSFD